MAPPPRAGSCVSLRTLLPYAQWNSESHKNLAQRHESFLQYTVPHIVPLLYTYLRMAACPHSHKQIPSITSSITDLVRLRAAKNDTLTPTSVSTRGRAIVREIMLMTRASLRLNCVAILNKWSVE
ncbi:unnamed protein product [Ceratitis capitata]|uniref:(Mediterranean fruit fly) hypothetical protein n=1 Tax=Ceratitis capitata TaxID=7213 RepID=A0A811UP42_CERCA|nr:unnamed protein product [Ceratitis capitata]